MKIPLTGGAGFLGSHLCEKLLVDGYEVICLDNFFTGNQRNIRHFMSNPKFEEIRQDVAFPIFLEVEGIFNLAMKTRARELQASTSEVYRDPEVSPQPETYWGNVNPIGNRSYYDEGKRAAETLFFDFHRQYQVDIRVARILNPYGPKMAMNDGRVVSNLIVQALNGEDLTIFGSGNQIHSFRYINDLIDGLIRLFLQSQFLNQSIWEIRLLLQCLNWQTR